VRLVLASVLVVGALLVPGAASAADYGLVLKADAVERFTYPFDAHLHRVVSVTNANASPVSAQFQVKATYPDGFGVQLSMSSPKGPYLLLAPGETQRIIVSPLWSELRTSTWKVGGTYPQRIRVDVFVGPSGDPQRLVLENAITVLAPLACQPRCRSPRPAGKPNAAVAGKVTDARGRGLAGVAVTLSAPNSAAASARVVTKKDGSFTSAVWTRKGAVSGRWTSFSVRALAAPSRRVQSRGVVVAVPEGRTTRVKLVLPARTEQASYTRAAAVSLGAQPWRGTGSSTGDLLAVAPRNADAAVLRVLDRAGTTLWANTISNGVAAAFAVSPDGQRVAVATRWRSPSVGADVVVFDRAGAEVGRFKIGGNRTTPQAVYIEARVLQFSPDSRFLFVGSGDGRWLLYDARTLAVAWQGGNAARHVIGDEATFSADGSRIYVGGGDGVVRALDTATGGLLWQTWTGGLAYSLALSGSRLAVSGDSAFATFVLNAADGAVLAQAPQEYHANDIAATGDGTRIYLAGGSDADGVCAAYDGSLRPLWDLGQPCDNVAADGSGKHVAVAGPDFVAVLSADGDVLWRAALPDAAAAGRGAKGSVWLSPDASRLVVVSPYTNHAYVYAGAITAR
jgi:outer membrane protein assembly factor BamB